MPDQPPAADTTAKPARQPQRHVICPAAELPPGQRRIVDLDGRSIGVFNIQGRYHAIANVCPHERAPLCKGTLAQTAYSDKPNQWNWDEDSCVIRCPWHGWEFDIKTGRSIFNPHRLGVRSYQVALEPTTTRTISATDPDPQLEVFTATLEAQHVVVYL